MKDVKPDFRIMEDNEQVPIGFQRFNYHMIFGVKMEDFRQKSRLVAGGNTTKPPETITYASVVSRETFRIALMLEALNGLEVKVADIHNSYITAPVTEKIWTVLGKGFGQDDGKREIIGRAIYGLKSAGAAFRNHLADCMKHLGYTPCCADPYIWLKPMVRPSDVFKYYGYILLYVDDVMVVHNDALDVLMNINKYFKLKPNSIGDPNIYLGAKLKKMIMANKVWECAISPARYVR